MKIGIAGPMSLDMLEVDWENATPPGGYPFPLISTMMNALIERDIDLVGYTYSLDISEPIVAKGNRLTVCVAPRSKQPGRKFFTQEQKYLIDLMHAFPADLINAQWSYEFALAAIKSKIPTVVTVHDHAWSIFKYQPDPFRFVRLILNNIVVNRATNLIVVSEYIKELIPKRYKRKANVIHNFYEPILEKFFNKKNAYENKIVTVANGFGKRKNIETGLKGFQLARRTNPDLEYHIIGAQMHENGPAHRFALQHQLTENVVFHGSMNYVETIDMISNSNILLHPSREESFGMTVLEAMVVGTNVIGGEKSGFIPYLLESGNHGLLCNIDSAEEIAKAILKYDGGEDLRELHLERAHNFALSSYSKDAIIDKLIKHYRYIINE